MALELFKPFVMKKLVQEEVAQNIKSAKRMVERRRPQVWDVLEEVIKEHPVLLNRAPTLHRLGIQAFEPVLVEGKAIQIHPLVCTAFNADFDGDQMAVHLPLSAEAQAEARVLMLSSNNILSPADGRPMVTPTQDMIIGAYYLTEQRPRTDGGEVVRHFKNVHAVEAAYELGRVELHEPIVYRIDELRTDDGWAQSTAGRVMFNTALPADFGFVNRAVRKREMAELVRQLSDSYGKAEVAEALDKIKAISYRFASQSGLTISIDDVRTPPSKKDILDRYEADAEKVENQYRRGIITDGERRQKEVDIWTSATEEVTAAMEKELRSTVFNPIDMMVGSGARGNMMQVRQIAGIRGLVANPRGDIIPRPIKNSYREGLSMLEYFIATPGARKGLVDTALRTADSGYLTRRLVDVAQELIINDEDPFDRSGPVRGIWIENVRPDGWYHRVTGEAVEPGAPEGSQTRSYLETRLFSRTLADDVTLADGTVVAAGTVVDEDLTAALRDDPDTTRVRVLSPLTDDSPFGVSAKGYGTSLATGRLIEVGEAVGVIAAQSIGEPGTQLTMRTFHTGGVAGTDIAGGLPRVVELFEARSPKGKAVLARSSGVVRIGEDDGRGRVIELVADDGTETTYTVASLARLAVSDGQEVRAGDALVEGPRDPKELLEIRGVAETQAYLVEEVQRVYRDQGVSIHDKHIELIVRQMTRRVHVVESGESEFLPGQQVDARVFREANRALVEEGKRPAEARPLIMGITKASLATDSWLSAASFQETTRVLTEAAIESRSDTLRGLKENIIIGKLIPAGTGMGTYRNVETSAPDYRPMEFWTSDEGEDPATYLASLQGGFEPIEVSESGNGEVIGFDEDAS
jgi:DNA-directed RNA polymerase subunit beta'